MAVSVLNGNSHVPCEVLIKSGSTVDAGALLKLTSGKVEEFTSTSTTAFGLCLKGGTGDGSTVYASVLAFSMPPTLRITWSGSAPANGSVADIDTGAMTAVAGGSDALVLDYDAVTGFAVIRMKAAACVA